MSKDISPKIYLIILVMISFIFLALGIPFLPIPFTRDQGIYAYVAWCWLGEWFPYQYAFEHKGPLLYLFYAISLKLSGGAMWGVNLADLVSRWLTVLFSGEIARRSINNRAGLLTIFFSSLWLAGIFNSCWWNAQAETFMMPTLSLAILFSIFGIKSLSALARNLSWLLCGFLLAQGMMFKLQAFVLELGLIAFILKAISRDEKKTILFHHLFGFLIGLFIWFFYFWLRGIGREFFEEVILFNWFHLQGYKFHWKEWVLLLWKGLWVIYGASLILLVFGLLWLFPRLKEKKLLLVLIWFFSCVFSVLLQKRLFLYHWLVCIPPSAVVLGFFISEFDKKTFKGKIVYACLILLVLIELIIVSRFYYLLQSHYRSFDYLTHRLSREKYYAIFREPPKNGYSDFNFYASWTVAHYVKEHTDPNDYVLVFGYEPLINYLSARRSPSRFHSDYPLNFEPKGSFARRYRNKWRRVFLAELSKRTPKFIILVKNDKNALESADSYLQAMRFDEFWHFISKYYLPSKRIEDFIFYERKNY